MPVEITGVDSVIRRFAAFERDANRLDHAFDAVADAVVARARSLVPVKTGALSASISASRGSHFASVSAGGGAVRYAGPIEYGWRRKGIRPQPFLRPAADTSTPLAVEELTDEIKKQIRANGLD